MKVFVSPHFDDAIGSCGCLINSLRNEEVCIATVFAGQHDGDISRFARKLLSIWGLDNGVIERIRENTEACRLIGAKTKNFDFVEAIYRKNSKWLYPNDGDIFGPIKDSDRCLTFEIAYQLMMSFQKDAVFFFPVGRGKHVDHLLVKSAGEILHSFGYHVLFYTDFSYEGGFDNRFEVKKTIMQFSINDLNQKIIAFNEYKSQLMMLFNSCDSREYFCLENLTEKGEVHEEYYEIV